MIGSHTGGNATADEIAQLYTTFIDDKIRPFSAQYTELASAARDDGWTCARIGELPPGCRQPGMLLAVVRLVTGSVPVDGPDLVERVHARWPEIAEQMRTRHPQGNEVGRCAAMLPAFDRVAGPVALIEVGTAAGLCLRPDRYHYTYRRAGVDVAELGPAGSPVRLECELRGTAPAPAALPEIVWRAGIDPEPLSVRDAADAAWLDCTIFPDHTVRRARLAAAVADARTDPPRIVTGDLVDDLAELAAQAPRDAQLVVTHSALLPHVEESRRRAFVELTDALGAVRIGMEAAVTMAELGVGPAGGSFDRRPMWVTAGLDVVATAEPYGAWLDSPPAFD